MSEPKAHRGRPKGSGIDDRTRLESIAAMIAANPELKPTTAIKSIGITDPSVIRRLRDKFHAAQVELMADLHGTTKVASAEVTNGAVSQIPAVVMPPQAAPVRAMAASVASPVKKSASNCVPEVAAQRTAIEPAVSTVRKPADPFDATAWLATMCGFGISAASTAVEAQLAFAQGFVRLPQVALLLRQHVAFNELAMAWAMPQPRLRTSLH